MNAGHHLADMTAAATNTVVTFSRRASSSVGPTQHPYAVTFGAARRTVGTPPPRRRLSQMVGNVKGLERLTGRRDAPFGA